MIIKISCPYCDNEDLKKSEGSYKNIDYGDFYCPECCSHLDLSEVDWEVLKEG